MNPKESRLKDETSNSLVLGLVTFPCLSCTVLEMLLETNTS